MEKQHIAPRRICVDRYSEAELAIRAAMIAVEKSGGSACLTDATNLLQAAKDAVADNVDGIETTRRFVREEPWHK